MKQVYTKMHGQKNFELVRMFHLQTIEQMLIKRFKYVDVKTSVL